MLPKLDKKFYVTARNHPVDGEMGVLCKAKDDSVVSDDEWCVFLAKDNGFYHAALPAYICEDHGCDEEQLQAIRAMFARVENWRMKNPDRCKDPDAAGEKLLP